MFLGRPIDDEVSNLIIAQLLHLEAEEPDQPHGGAQGQSSDIEIRVREMVEMRQRMTAILAEATGRDPAQITADIDRDHILRGDDAVAYGLVDHVIHKRELTRLEPAR